MGNDVYDMILRPKGKSVVSSIWIYKNKYTKKCSWFVLERIDYSMTWSYEPTHFSSRIIYRAKNNLYRIGFVRAQKEPIDKHI